MRIDFYFKESLDNDPLAVWFERQKAELDASRQALASAIEDARRRRAAGMLLVMVTLALAALMLFHQAQVLISLELHLKAVRDELLQRHVTHDCKQDIN
jgi:hypothetical protein